MKSSDLPLLQFFTKTSTVTDEDTSGHDIIDDLAITNDDDDDDDDDENHTEKQLAIENVPRNECAENDDSNDGTIMCPVCQKMLLGDNDKINKHIDLCLNGEMIRTTIQEEDQRTASQFNEKKR
jgi:hypothetical protein